MWGAVMSRKAVSLSGPRSTLKGGEGISHVRAPQSVTDDSVTEEQAQEVAEEKAGAPCALG